MGWEVRRRIDDPALMRLRIDDCERRHALTEFRIAPRGDAVGPVAAGLRITAILRDAEDESVGR